MLGFRVQPSLTGLVKTVYDFPGLTSWANLSRRSGTQCAVLTPTHKPPRPPFAQVFDFFGNLFCLAYPNHLFSPRLIKKCL
jgi:hypothetical protein